MTLRLNGTTSGYTELDSAAIGNNNLLTLPTTTAGTLIAADSSGVLQMNSGYGSNANAYGCRAWVNFNGTGTVAIRASGNVSSITDNGTGDYTVNFTTALADTNYAVLTTCRDDGNANFVTSLSLGLNLKTTTAVRVLAARRDSGSLTDSSEYNVAIFR
jgi:hypothetical protein